MLNTKTRRVHRYQNRTAKSVTGLSHFGLQNRESNLDDFQKDDSAATLVGRLIRS